jgi:hypothetical protein
MEAKAEGNVTCYAREIGGAMGSTAILILNRPVQELGKNVIIAACLEMICSRMN